MKKRTSAITAWIVLFIFLFACAPSMAEGTLPSVYSAADAPAFDPDSRLLEMYVCPLLGADSMILLYDGHSMLIDMGKANDYETILSLLRQLSLDTVEIAFNTHPHTDHLGAMKKLLQTVHFERFITVFPADYTGNGIIQRSALQALKAANVPIETLSNGDLIPFGDVDITVLRRDQPSTTNHMSAMLMVRYLNRSLLLAADVIDNAQIYFARHFNLKADILKYPHHALQTLHPDFLNAISPEYAIITHGSVNTRDAQKQLTNNGIAFDIATKGIIHISTDGSTWHVEQLPSVK